MVGRAEPTFTAAVGIHNPNVIAVRRGVIFVGEFSAIWGPVGSVAVVVIGQLLQLPVLEMMGIDIPYAVAEAHISDLFSVGRQGRVGICGVVLHKVALIPTVCINNIKFGIEYAAIAPGQVS